MLKQVIYKIILILFLTFFLVIFIFLNSSFTFFTFVAIKIIYFCRFLLIFKRVLSFYSKILGVFLNVIACFYLYSSYKQCGMSFDVKTTLFSCTINVRICARINVLKNVFKLPQGVCRAKFSVSISINFATISDTFA